MPTQPHRTPRDILAASIAVSRRGSPVPGETGADHEVRIPLETAEALLNDRRVSLEGFRSNAANTGEQPKLVCGDAVVDLRTWEALEIVRVLSTVLLGRPRDNSPADRAIDL